MAAQRGNPVSPIHPWRRHSNCALLVDPDTFIPALLAAIDSADKYVLIEMYLVESGATCAAIIDALRAAADRGVHIYMVFDGVGSRQLHHSDRARLKHPHIELAYYHPVRLWTMRNWLVRDHRKLLLVDGRVGFTGSLGFCDGIDTGDGEVQPWHDTVVRFEGSVVNDWQNMFAAHWQDITNVELNLDGQVERPVNSGQVRLIAAQPARLNPIYGHVRQRAWLASRRLWIATAYFLPSWRLRRAIRAAAARGVDVRLLLPGPITDHPAVRHASQGFYAGLLNAGARIFEYQPAFQHAKVTLVDDWVSIGSSNFDRWSMARNLEVNLEVEQENFCADVAGFFARDFADSIEVTRNNWEQRPRLQRWKERIWGAAESWLDK